ncbi:hypothetical protein CDD83_7880 [Cordyceps sp. RAO-2017]|nr:hypothetical protein CDD83_7880 [Cordyceps sp. RAO-2017]
MCRLDLLVGFEVEFEVFRADAGGRLVPHSAGLGTSACAGLRDPSFAQVEEAMQALLEAGVGLEVVHAEGARGQYEFVLGPRPPLEAVDELVLVQDTLKRVFGRHGLVATMFPRPLPARFQSNGQHTHLSIGRPELEQRFLAGLLARLPGLCAVCMPFDLSYERARPRLAGDVVAWGTEDRSVPVRRIKPGHWEIRPVDATANMYLALAALLSAGLAGCVNDEPLLLPDTAAEPDPDAPAARGPPLPTSLDEALDRLAEIAPELEAIMQSRVLQNFLGLKRAEAFKLRAMGDDEARCFLTQLF